MLVDLTAIHICKPWRSDAKTVSSSFLIECIKTYLQPRQEIQMRHALTDLGRPDGRTGGFYALMRRTHATRVEILRRLFNEAQDDYREEALILALRDALAKLRSAPRPQNWSSGDNEDMHMLKADAVTHVKVGLFYEKRELKRDIAFLQGRFDTSEGLVFAGEDLDGATACKMTPKEAQALCKTLRGCRGFTVVDGWVNFKKSWDLQTAVPGGTSFCYRSGEEALLDLLQEQHNADLEGLEWVDGQKVKPWDEALQEALFVLRAATDGGQHNASGRKAFRNFLTDRDGTTNNYCDRYASSVQSAYNAAWLCHFAQGCVDHPVFNTAAPLGGRPSAEGLMELCVMPRGIFTFTGSKGREYFHHGSQQVLESEEMLPAQREVLDELYSRLKALCSQPANTKFLGIGSGLQRKFGEVTMSRNDPAGTVPCDESGRFVAEVRRVVKDLGGQSGLDIHDTGTDLEIFPHMTGGRQSFDKGRGVRCLDAKLRLDIATGPNLICGDTSSDVAMVEAALQIMCKDYLHVVDKWREVIRRDSASERAVLEPLRTIYAPEEVRHRDDAEQQNREERDEKEAREIGSKLAVIFVVSPREHRSSPTLATTVRRWCELSGAHCAIVPSPDILMAALAAFADEQAGGRVTDKPADHRDPAVCSRARI